MPPVRAELHGGHGTHGYSGGQSIRSSVARSMHVFEQREKGEDAVLTREAQDGRRTA